DLDHAVHGLVPNLLERSRDLGALFLLGAGQVEHGEDSTELAHLLEGPRQSDHTLEQTLGGLLIRALGLPDAGAHLSRFVPMSPCCLRLSPGAHAPLCSPMRPCPFSPLSLLFLEKT